MRSFAVMICPLVFCLAIFPSVSTAEGLSREQGDAILEELRQIRTLLERQPRRPLGPQMFQPQPPVPQERMSIPLGDGPSLGRLDAPVTIVEYMDYQCPFCERFRTDAFPALKKNLIDTGKVRFVKRDLPLPAHAAALKAAQAARCAGDQGKFWEMHDLLLAGFSTLGPDAFARFARELSLDAQAFKACLDSDRHVEDIRAIGREAAAAGITGTPTFVVGTIRGSALEGIRIVGAQPYEVFEKAVEEFLTANPASCPH
jgi:protein-disulfide isomerase